MVKKIKKIEEPEAIAKAKFLKNNQVDLTGEEISIIMEIIRASQIPGKFITRVADIYRKLEKNLK